MYTFGFSGPFAFSRKAPASFVEPGRLFAYMNTALNECIFVKFYIGDLCENMLRKSKFGQNQTKIWDTLHEDQSTFYGSVGDKIVLKALLTATYRGTMQRECVVSFPFLAAI
jgi:hypothetical protein